MIVSPGVQHREKHRAIGLRARVRLHVGRDLDRRQAEQSPGSLDRERFGDIDELAATVIALARIAFRVLVRQLAALRGQYRRTRVILRRNQLDVLFLAPVFVRDRRPDLGVDVGDRMRASLEHVVLVQMQVAGSLAIVPRRSAAP
jgi:hypothetical protein